MIVGQSGMPVRVRVRLAWGIVGAVLVLVVLVVIVEVVVLERLVGVLVGVALAYQQGHAERHQTHRAELGQAERIAEERHGGGSPDERGRGEIGGLAGRTVQA